MNRNTNVLVVGLTGQTGAGKSTISKVFADNGFTVINADKISRIIVEKGSRCLDEICNFFGNEILKENGTLNRYTLAKIVFTDKSKLELLNKIVHPYIKDKILKKIKAYSKIQNSMILIDAPTLFESKVNNLCEIVISVIADFEIREKNIIKRDGLNQKQARDRITSQLDEKFFIEYSDYIIENNDSLERLYSISQEVSDKIKY